MKKLNKEFLITDSSVNVYGFRLLTSGYQIDEFKKNPIGYHMHGESKEFPREAGVLVRWEGFRIEGDRVYAKPVINLNHPRGQKTAEEIEEGFLNGASLGKIIALEMSDDPALMLPGQTGPTITKWYNRECSLVDIPGNMNTLALFDANGQPVNLSDLRSTKKVSISNPATTTENAPANNSFKSVKDQLSEAFQKNTITDRLLHTLKAQFSNDPKGLSEILKVMAEARRLALVQLSWQELDKQGLLSELKERDLTAFKEKYKQQFQKEYQS